MFSSSNHTFVVCAYKESPYLVECVQSLLDQTIEPNIILSTSTPNDYIKGISSNYSIPLVINKTKPGIASDWNNALDAATTDLVTIAHQDDVYDKKYLEDVLAHINRSKDPLLYFTNYGELRNGLFVDNNKLLKVKRMMLAPLKLDLAKSSVFVRRRIMSIGSPICCPSVTMIKSKLGPQFFKNDFMSNLDWQAWADLALKKGDFIYNSEIRMHHRIHEDSETSHLIHNSKREAEDLQMLQSFWPKPIASMVFSIYVKGQQSNER